MPVRKLDYATFSVVELLLCFCVAGYIVYSGETGSRPLKVAVVIRAVPDFDSGRKPPVFTNLAQIRLQPKCSQISVFGRICRMAHANTAMVRISTSFEKQHSRCCHIFDSFVYFVEILASSHD